MPQIQSGKYLFLFSLAITGCAGEGANSLARGQAGDTTRHGLVVVQSFEIKTDMKGDVRVWGSWHPPAEHDTADSIFFGSFAPINSAEIHCSKDSLSCTERRAELRESEKKTDPRGLELVLRPPSEFHVRSWTEKVIIAEWKSPVEIGTLRISLTDKIVDFTVRREVKVPKSKGTKPTLSRPRVYTLE